MHEPHVASKVFKGMLSAAGRVRVRVRVRATVRARVRARVRVRFRVEASDST